MTPTDAIRLAAVFTAGTGLGAVFFGGLWLTVRWALFAQFSALWIAGSLFARIGLVMAGFYFVADGQWQRWLACLAGFIAARLLIGRLLPKSDAAPYAASPTGPRRHAP
jgi:F1F0 ATPase subunit 2